MTTTPIPRVSCAPAVAPLRSVLFDFDGTLLPSLPLWVKAYHHALNAHGVSISDDEVLSRCFFRDFAEVAAEFGVGSAADLEHHVKLGLQLAFVDAELFPRVRELIELCRRHELQTALVTSSPRQLVDEVSERLLLRELFDFIVCGDEVTHYKPHPEPLLKALAALDCKPAEAVMIGDSHVDILAGKAAGTRTALFLPEDHGRFHDTERLRATQPDHVFTHHWELPAILGLPAWEVDG
jgi:pyrophosphatase PpaX